MSVTDVAAPGGGVIGTGSGALQGGRVPASGSISGSGETSLYTLYVVSPRGTAVSGTTCAAAPMTGAARKGAGSGGSTRSKRKPIKPPDGSHDTVTPPGE